MGFIYSAIFIKTFSILKSFFLPLANGGRLVGFNVGGIKLL